MLVHFIEIETFLYKYSFIGDSQDTTSASNLRFTDDRQTSYR